MTTDYRRSIPSTLGLLSLLLIVAATPLQAQWIDGLSPTEVTRSGRLLITGQDFAATQGSGRVLIDGLEAIVTTWTESEIHAYVPEAASLGLVAVEVQTDSGFSNLVDVDVGTRGAEGRMKWRFQLDSAYAGPWSAIGPDGTVYTSDDQQLYALTPDGALKWILPGAGEGRPISFGADGTIYTGTSFAAGQPQGVIAVNPDGGVKWTFTFNDGHDILVGPSVGPDGNIYGVQDSLFGGSGAFALDRDGNLLWTNPGPWSTVGSSYKVLFADDRFFAAYQSDASGAPTILAYEYSGNLLWNSFDLGQVMGSYPELDPSGRLILGWGLIGEQAWFEDGSIDWIYDPPGSLGNVVQPTVGPDGVIYNGTWLGGDLFAVNPDGTTRWLVEDGISGFLGALAVTPDNAVLLDGGSPGFGNPSFMRGFATSDGTQLFQQNFMVENGLNEFAHWIEPAISSDSQTAYGTTRFSSSTQGGYLWAVDVGSQVPGCLVNCLRSTRLDLRGRPSGETFMLAGRILITDEAGAQVPGAGVSVVWTLPNGNTTTRSATTDSRGQVRFNVTGGAGTYDLTITDISKAGYSFDAENSILSKSLTL